MQFMSGGDIFFFCLTFVYVLGTTNLIAFKDQGVYRTREKTILHHSYRTAFNTSMCLGGFWFFFLSYPLHQVPMRIGDAVNMIILLPCALIAFYVWGMEIGSQPTGV